MALYILSLFSYLKLLLGNLEEIIEHFRLFFPTELFSLLRAKNVGGKKNIPAND